MGLEFLARVRSSTLWLAALAAVMAATYAGWRTGAGLAAGAAWSLANLWALERLVVTVTGPERRTSVSARRAALVLAGMLALFGAGALLLRWLPPAALVAGFVTPFAVMVFKALRRRCCSTRRCGRGSPATRGARSRWWWRSRGWPGRWRPRCRRWAARPRRTRRVGGGPGGGATRPAPGGRARG